MSTCPMCGASQHEGSYCPHCGTPTPTLAVDSVPAAAGAFDSRERLQTVLGKGYVLGALLGRGGFGEVYAAFDTRLKREVAIKVLRGEHASSADFASRFRREAEAVAQLRHPNIVPIYTIGDEEGVAFFVMPRINGISLAERMTAGRPLPESEACRIVLESARALAAAHRAGVIHRDVKPENILLDGEEQRALLMDFGIATRTDGSGAALTRTGSIIGTPAYMSPEQATGDHVTASSDIYSLGIVAYQMLAGALPFGGGSLQEMLVGHLTREPARLTGSPYGVTPAIAAVVMRCLAKHPAERFESGGALVSALEDALGSAVITGALVRERATAAPPTRREWTLIAFTGVAGVVWAVATLAQGASTRVDDPGVSRFDATRASSAFFSSQGAAGNFSEDAVLSTDNAARDFLIKRLGQRKASEWVEHHLPVSYWRVTWTPRDASKQWIADIAAGGRVAGYELPVGDSTALSDSGSDAVARAALFGLGLDTSSLVLDNQRSVNRLKAAERTFVWNHRFPELDDRGRDTFQVHGDFSATVKGARVTRVHARLHTPKVQTDPIANFLPGLVLMVIVATMAFGVVRLMRVGLASSPGSAEAGCSVAVATLLLFALRWDVLASSSIPIWLLVAASPIVFLLIATMATLLFMGADGALAPKYDVLRADWSVLRVPGLRSTGTAVTILVGVALGLGFQVLEAFTSGDSSSLGSSSFIVSAKAPFLFVLLLGCALIPVVVTPLAFAFGILGRLMRSKWAATVLILFISALELSRPLWSWSTLFSFAIGACVVLTFIRFGVLCSLIQFTVAGVFPTAVEMAGSSESSVQASGYALLALLTLIAVGAAARIAGGSRVEGFPATT